MSTKGFWLLFVLLLVFEVSQAQAGRNPSARSVANNNEPVDVLFATNHDCDLYVNNEMKGLISKSNFLYVKLAPGNYTYRAVSKSSLDEMTDSFSVSRNGLNEIFLDVLLLVDEKNLQRELARSRPPSLLSTYGRDSDAVQDGRKYLANIKEVMVNTLLETMVKIKGGNFLMGNNRSPVPDEIEHKVSINSFYISKFEVTNHQWESIMGYNPSLSKSCGTCPVSNVTWEEAVRFVRKLSAVSNKKFRLPTEAEWEYVAKIGGKAEIDAAGGQDEYIKKAAWNYTNSNAQVQAIGTKQPNAAGVYDMIGNVSEWCSDWYGMYYSKDEFNQVNPEGPPLGKEKVVRGGNFKDYIGDRFRPSLRNKRNPLEKGTEIGFRLAMDAME